MTKKMAVALSALLSVIAGCGGGSESPHERLIGSWIYTNASDTGGISLQFNEDKTYAVQILRLTSATSAYDEAELGIYSATDAEITFTPQKYSCPKPNPPYGMTYTFNRDSLAVGTTEGVIAFTQSTGSTASNVVVTFGCFQSDGSFVASPIAPVSN